MRNDRIRSGAMVPASRRRSSEMRGPAGQLGIDWGDLTCDGLRVARGVCSDLYKDSCPADYAERTNGGALCDEDDDNDNPPPQQPPSQQQAGMPGAMKWALVAIAGGSALAYFTQSGDGGDGGGDE